MRVLAILTLLFIPISAHAQKSAKQLAEVCTSDDPVSQALCIGYIRGTIESYMAMAALDALADRPHFELTGKYDVPGLRDAFLTYFKDYSGSVSQSANGALIFAWLDHNLIRLSTAKERGKP